MTSASGREGVENPTQSEPSSQADGTYGPSATSDTFDTFNSSSSDNQEEFLGFPDPQVTYVSHALCPVAALRRYIDITSNSNQDQLFVYPTTDRPLTRLAISHILCELIELADPGSAPRGHDVRAMSATLSFLQHFSLERLRQEGQWASHDTFIRHYLRHEVDRVPCVTMSGLPPPPPESPM